MHLWVIRSSWCLKCSVWISWISTFSESLRVTASTQVPRLSCRRDHAHDAPAFAEGDGNGYAVVRELVLATVT